MHDGKKRRVSRWEHENVIEAAESLQNKFPEAMLVKKTACGTSVWHDKVMDGRNALSDENTEKCRSRDEFACSGLQYEASDQYLGRVASYGGNQILTRLFL